MALVVPLTLVGFVVVPVVPLVFELPVPVLPLYVDVPECLSHGELSSSCVIE